MSNPVVLNVNDWDTSSLRYMQPKISDRGAKTIALISTQTNRALHLSVPLMMTWGISDYVNEQGESDGKFSMTLNFPNKEYTNESTDTFLQKLKDFENQILDDAVKYSDAWFGEDLSREVVKHNFFPFLKYSKDKLTKKIDLEKPLRLEQEFLVIMEIGMLRSMILRQLESSLVIMILLLLWILFRR